MHTKQNEQSNGINVELVSGNFTTVAKQIGVSAQYVRDVAHDRVLLSERDTLTVRMIVKALKEIEEAMLRAKERKDAMGNLRDSINE